jgi:hypothetical protein
MRPFFRACLALCALCLPLSLPLTVAAAPKAPAADPKATAIFEKACAHLAGLKGFSFKAEVLVDLVYKGSAKIQVARSMDVTVQRPNAFKIVTTGDDVSSTSVYDGKAFTLALGDRYLYNRLPAALTNDALVDLLHEKYGLDSPLGDLLRNETCQGMGYHAVSYLGLGHVGRIRCHHLFFQGTDVDWQLWIEDGPDPLLRKLLITEKRMPLAPQFTAILRDWTIADTPAAFFDYTPPANFTRDDNLFTHLRLEVQGGRHAVK